jgi:hypothetical protein
LNDQEKRLLDTFKRVRDFYVAHDILFPTGTLARDLFDTIGGVVNDLEGYAAAEFGGRGAARQGTATKALAKAAILKDLAILRRTARAMSVNMPGFEEKFRVPYKQDGQELVTTARAALMAAEPLKAEFLRREVQERVFQSLAANIAAYEAAITERNTAREERVAATASIDAAIEIGLNALRQLDPIVRNKLHNNTATLAAWLSAKRVERAPRRNNTNTLPAPQTPNT